MGSNESFVSAAWGQQARRCCYFKAPIEAHTCRRRHGGFDASTQGLQAVWWVDGIGSCQPEWSPCFFEPLCELLLFFLLWRMTLHPIFFSCINFSFHWMSVVLFSGFSINVISCEHRRTIITHFMALAPAFDWWGYLFMNPPSLPPPPWLYVSNIGSPARESCLAQ